MKKFMAFLCVAAMALTFVPTSFANSTSKVLSDNKFSDGAADIAYKNKGIINTGATYLWTADSDTDMIGLDSKNTKLTDGACDTTDGNYVTGTKWDAVGTSTAIFDLKKICTVTQIDVWSKNHQNEKMGKFTVETSKDNITYTQVGVGTAVHPEAENIMFSTTAALTSSDAQYVKITIYKAPTYRMAIGEVVILGAESVDPKVELKESIKHAQKYVDSDLSSVYTLSSWNALTTAIINGNEVMGNTSATSAEIANAITQLNNSISSLVCLFERNVISSNKFLQEEKASFPNVYNNNSTYAFESVFTTDTTMLTNGGTFSNSTVGSELLWGGWDSGATAIAVFDLKGEFCVSNVAVYSVHNVSDSKFMEEFDIEVSKDKINYSKIATVKATKATSGASLLRSAGEFVPQKANYVRITMKNGVGSHQLVLGEIVIEGFNSKVDKKPLADAITSANSLDKSIFTIASWETLTNVLVSANTVYKNDKASLEEVNNAVAQLMTAVNNLKYLYVNKVLTDNSFTTDDLVLYAMESETTNVKYEWLEGGNPELISNDGGVTATAKKMQSGAISVGVDGNSMLFGKWDDQTPTTAKYTFPVECYITQVDVWSQMVKNSVRMGGFKVEVSTDNVYYTEVASIVNPTWHKDLAVDEKRIVNTVAKFPAVKARYVKITAYNSSINGVGENSYQLVLSEIVMQGFKAPFVPPIEFETFSLSYADKNTFVPINKLSEIRGNILIDGEVFNNSNMDKNVAVISVLYDNFGKMVGMGVNTVNAIKGQRTAFGVTIDNLTSNITDTYSLKTYVWDSLNSCVALANVKTFGELAN